MLYFAMTNLCADRFRLNSGPEVDEPLSTLSENNFNYMSDSVLVFTEWTSLSGKIRGATLPLVGADSDWLALTVAGWY